MIRLKHITKSRDRHGNLRLFVRLKGVKPWIRLREEPGSDGFLDEYRTALQALRTGASVDAIRAALAAERGQPVTMPAKRQPARPAKPGSLAALCQAFFASGEFQQNYSERTRYTRRRLLDRICAAELGDHSPYGELPANGVTMHHVRALRDAAVDRPEAANDFLKALRKLYKWAIETKQPGITDNPAANVAKLDSDNPDGHRTWTQDEIDQYFTAHPLGTKAHLAGALLRYTGVRRSDVVRLGPQMERGGELVFKTFKGRRKNPIEVSLPILPPLRAAIDKCPSGQLAYLATDHGAAFTAEYFGKWFKQQCQAAGLPGDCTAHGVRKFDATHAAGQGATAHDLMALFGWKTLAQAQRYTEKFDRRRRATTAAPALLAEQTTDESVTPLPEPSPGVTKSA